MGTEVIVAIFTAAGVIAAAGIAAIPQRPGWRQRVQKDLEVFYKLFPLADSISDSVILDEYRSFIFSSVKKEVSPQARRHPFISSLIIFSVAFAAGLIINYLRGVPITPALIAFLLVSALVGCLIGWVLSEILVKFPKTDHNPLYRISKEIEELRAESKKIEEEAKEMGLVSNYAAYRSWRRRKWDAHLYQEVVWKYRNAAAGNECGDDDVDADESNEEFDNVAHDDLHGECDAVDGNATGGVERDG